MKIHDWSNNLARDCISYLPYIKMSQAKLNGTKDIFLQGPVETLRVFSCHSIRNERQPKSLNSRKKLKS